MPDLRKTGVYRADLLKLFILSATWKKNCKPLWLTSSGSIPWRGNRLCSGRKPLPEEIFIVLMDRSGFTRVNVKTEEEEAGGYPDHRGLVGIGSPDGRRGIPGFSYFCAVGQGVEPGCGPSGLLLEEIGGLGERLKMLYESYLRSLKSRLTWRNPGEPVYFIARRHPFFLFFTNVPAGDVGPVWRHGDYVLVFYLRGNVDPFVDGDHFLGVDPGVVRLGTGGLEQ
jgi:hypothetical protein